MHIVYRNSYCNIAASDSADSEGGLHRPRTVEEIVPARFPVDGEIPTGNLQGAWRVIPVDLWARDILGQLLYKREWVFQDRISFSFVFPFLSPPPSQSCKTRLLIGVSIERMIGPRAIHFIGNQTF